MRTCTLNTRVFISSILATAVLAAVLSSTANATDLNKVKLQGNVASITQIVYIPTSQPVRAHIQLADAEGTGVPIDFWCLGAVGTSWCVSHMSNFFPSCTPSYVDTPIDAFTYERTYSCSPYDPNAGACMLVEGYVDHFDNAAQVVAWSNAMSFATGCTTK